MTARLLCRTGELAGTTHELGPSNTIGRGAENEVVLDSGLVSNRHARIYEDEGKWYVEDLGSLKGTRLDGMLLTGPTALERLDVITFAEKLDFIFVPPQFSAGASSREQLPSAEGTRVDPTPFGEFPELEGEAAPPAVESDGDEGTRVDLTPFGEFPELKGEAAPPTVEATGQERTGVDMAPLGERPKPEGEAPPPAVRVTGDERTRVDLSPFGGLPDLEGETTEPESEEAPEADHPAPSIFLIEIRHDDGPPRTYELPEGRTVLGRGRNCDITIDDKLLSRKHAQLVVRRGEVVIDDLDSKNGTYIDDERLESAVLRPGQSFRLGPLTHVTLQM